MVIFLVHTRSCRCNNSAVIAPIFTCDPPGLRSHPSQEEDGLRLEVVGSVRAGFSCNKAVTNLSTVCAMAWSWQSAIVVGCVSDSLLWLSEEDREKGKQGHAIKRSKSWSQTSKIGRSRFQPEVSRDLVCRQDEYLLL